MITYPVQRHAPIKELSRVEYNQNCEDAGPVRTVLPIQETTMNIKKSLPALTLALLMLFSVSAAMAQSKDKPAPPQGKERPALPEGAPPARLSPEDLAAIKAMRQEHHQKVDPIRDQLWAKQMEYDALTANPNSQHADIKAVIEEMKGLRAQLRAEKRTFQEAMEARGFDFGPGRHGPRFGGDCFDREFGPKHPKAFKGHGQDRGPRHHGGDRWND